MMDIAYILGQNIKKHRKGRGLTQQELAAALNVTPQNVSKWEKGRSMPDVRNLCALTGVLGVTADELLKKDADGQGKIMLGIDGGGSKTEFCVFTETGSVLMRKKLGGTNPNAYGTDGAAATLKEGIDWALSHYPDITAVFAGIAGCADEKNAVPLTAFIKENYPLLKAEVGGDVLNAVYSTPHYENCTVVIVGTGSVIFVKNKDGMKRIGGWGHLFDDGYNGFHLGCQTLRAVIADEDGVGQSTSLTAALQKELGGPLTQNMGALYKMSNETLASYTRFLFDAYDDGDDVARNIIRTAMARLREMLRIGAQAYPQNVTVVTGGLTARRDIMLELIEEAKDFIFPEMPPVYGACHYCVLRFGKPTEEFYKNFKMDYEELVL